MISRQNCLTWDFLHNEISRNDHIPTYPSVTGMDLLFDLQYLQAKIFKSYKKQSERGQHLPSIFKFRHYQQNRAIISK